MDLLEFTGIDRRYYQNERLKKFFRWLFGSSVNCSKEMAIFGDMLPTQNISNDMLHRRVINFDHEAAGYAAWFHEGTPAIGNILTYILPNETLPTAVVPTSKIYSNGGAFFRERSDNPDGLHAVLYNIQSQDEWHTHNEVNGLALSGYGNRLLVNGGRLGEPTRLASLNNTLTINGENHQARVGEGIFEGFTTDQLDYASGGSGPALVGARHIRNMLLVHGSSQASAYFVVFDEVEANPGDQVKNYLHPSNQTSITTIAPGVEYLAPIDHNPTVTGTNLTLFYATPPTSVNIEKVPSAVQDRYPGYPEHNRLESLYNTDEFGKRNLLTILFPHKVSHPKPSISRISTEGCTGASIDHGGLIYDLLLESSGEQTLNYQQVTFNATSILVRTFDSQNSFYFVRQGTHLDHNGIGFNSDIPVSIFSYNTHGVIISEGAKIMLKGANPGNVKFEPSVDIISSGDDFIEILLPKGQVQF